MGEAAYRLIEQGHALIAYFVEFVPKKKGYKRFISKLKYLLIVNWLRKSAMKAEIEFVVNSANTFTVFTGVL